jgi:hypothetical protein
MSGQNTTLNVCLVVEQISHIRVEVYVRVVIVGNGGVKRKTIGMPLEIEEEMVSNTTL